jgi:hypothetical protein
MTAADQTWEKKMIAAKTAWCAVVTDPEGNIRRHILHFIAVALACTVAVAAYGDDNKEKEQKEIRTMAAVFPSLSRAQAPVSRLYR